MNRSLPFFLVLPLILFLIGCQTRPPKTCPLSQTDTKVQEDLCKRYAREKAVADINDPEHAHMLKQTMLQTNCGLFF